MRSRPERRLLGGSCGGCWPSAQEHARAPVPRAAARCTRVAAPPRGFKCYGLFKRKKGFEGRVLVVGPKPEGPGGFLFQVSSPRDKFAGSLAAGILPKERPLLHVGFGSCVHVRMGGEQS